MNANHDHELEARIDRELKSLPPLSAPPTLAPSIMARLAGQEEVAWYRRAWPAWPLALRAASLVVLLALFGGLCFAGWSASHAPGVTTATGKVGGMLAGKVEGIEKGTVHLFWYPWFKLGGQADFFLLFVISSFGAGLVVLLLTPMIKRMIKRIE